MAHQEVEKEYENQRIYESELTPEQRAQEYDHYSEMIAYNLTDSKEWQAKQHTFDHWKAEEIALKNELENRAKITADILEKVYLDLQEKAWKSEQHKWINVYTQSYQWEWSTVWKDAVDQALLWMERYAIQLLGYIFEELKKKWLYASRPAYDYFISKPDNYAAYLRITDDYGTYRMN